MTLIYKSVITTLSDFWGDYCPLAPPLPPLGTALITSSLEEESLKVLELRTVFKVLESP